MEEGCRLINLELVPKQMMKIACIGVFWLCFLWIGTVTAFLLKDECPAPSPCTCSGSPGSYIYIRCNSKSLTTVPKFTTFNNHVNTLYVYLQSNNLKNVPAHAFKNLSSINASTVYIYLNNNHLNQIDRDAFSDLQNATNVYLYLQNNNLTSFAATKLNSVIYLDIQNNPIRSLDSSSMLSLGSRLQTLFIDFGSFTEWPRELRHLTHLETLSIRNVPFLHLESEIFHGFEHSLTSLTLDNSRQLEKIPFAVCNLPKLQSLSFNNCPSLKENRSSIFEHCQGHHSTLTSITLNNDGLHSFPELFGLFPSLTTISLQSNSLELIEAEKIPYHNQVTNINLYNNKFKRVPSAFHKLRLLKTVGLMRNDIMSVEDFDINFLKDLTSLDLDNNPIRYISSNAFKGNQKLQTIYLQNTKLMSIPASVLSLPALRTFYVTGTPIECSCDMSYLRHWNVTAVPSFNGQCYSLSQSVKSYILTNLQQCP